VITEYQKFLEWTEKEEAKGRDWKGKLKRQETRDNFKEATGAYEKITKKYCPICGFQKLWKCFPPEGSPLAARGADHVVTCEFCGSKFLLEIVEVAPYIDNILMSWVMAFEDAKGDFETIEAVGFADAAKEFLTRKGLDPKSYDVRKGRYEGRRIVALSSSKL
jgi:transcription elongation factor Elf1